MEAQQTNTKGVEYLLVTEIKSFPDYSKFRSKIQKCQPEKQREIVIGQVQ